IGEHLPLTYLPEASVTQTRFINPAIVLKHDISSNGQVFYRKGSRVNPLNIVRPVTNLLFFDAKSPAQKQLALAALKDYPYQLVLVLTRGDPVKLASLL